MHTMAYRSLLRHSLVPIAIAWMIASGAACAADDAADDAAIVAALDVEYQAAVKNSDAATMAKILADDFALVSGSGKTFSKNDLLAEARNTRLVYERQEASERKVRVWGDTAVVTALLWVKGVDDGKPFEARLWYSDTYVRTANRWRYVFGQASRALPETFAGTQ